MESRKWHLDTERWPGPCRPGWKIDRDVVEPSPDGRWACVFYSCCEIRVGCEVGLLTLLSGPPGVAHCSASATCVHLLRFLSETIGAVARRQQVRGGNGVSPPAGHEPNRPPRVDVSRHRRTRLCALPNTSPDGRSSAHRIWRRVDCTPEPRPPVRGSAVSKFIGVGALEPISVAVGEFLVRFNPAFTIVVARASSYNGFRRPTQEQRSAPVTLQ